jgi:DNA polymerase III epsilon subunit-like protein
MRDIGSSGEKLEDMMNLFKIKPEGNRKLHDAQVDANCTLRCFLAINKLTHPHSRPHDKLDTDWNFAHQLVNMWNGKNTDAIKSSLLGVGAFKRRNRNLLKES